MKGRSETFIRIQKKKWIKLEYLDGKTHINILYLFESKLHLFFNVNATENRVQIRIEDGKIRWIREMLLQLLSNGKM